MNTARTTLCLDVAYSDIDLFSLSYLLFYLYYYSSSSYFCLSPSRHFATSVKYFRIAVISSFCTREICQCISCIRLPKNRTPVLHQPVQIVYNDSRLTFTTSIVLGLCTRYVYNDALHTTIKMIKITTLL